MRKHLLYVLLLLMISSCGEHDGKIILEYTGDYIYSHGVAFAVSTFGIFW